MAIHNAVAGDGLPEQWRAAHERDGFEMFLVR